MKTKFLRLSAVAIMVVTLLSLGLFISCKDDNALSKVEVSTKSSIVIPDGDYTFYNVILTFMNGEVVGFKDGETGESLDPPVNFANKYFPKTKQGEADAMALLEQVKDFPCVDMGIIHDEQGTEYWLVTWSNPPCNCK